MLKIDEEKLVEAYNRLKSYRLVADEFDIARGTVANRLKKLNIKINLTGGKNETIILKENLIKLINKNLSAAQIGKLYNISARIIYRIADEYNIKIENKTKFKRIYSLNQNFFDEINEKSMYWAGFIAADGCISKKDYRLSIGLASKDKSHIEKFQNDIGFNGPIFDLETDPYFINARKEKYYRSSISIISKNICKKLKKFNIVPRKSLIYDMPKWLIEHPLINHFIRGYIDGDGCYYIRKKDNLKDQYYFSVLGTNNFIKQTQNIFKNNLKNTSKNTKFNKIPYPRHNGSVFNLSFSGNKILKSIVEFLYKDAETYLDRKYNIIKHFINTNNNENS